MWCVPQPSSVTRHRWVWKRPWHTQRHHSCRGGGCRHHALERPAGRPGGRLLGQEAVGQGGGQCAPRCSHSRPQGPRVLRKQTGGLIPHQGQGIMCRHLTAWVAPVTPAAPRGEPKTEAAASRPRQERPGELATPRHSRKEMGLGPGERSADPHPLPQGFCPRTSPHLTGPQTLLLSSRDPLAGEAGHRNGWTTLCQNPPETKASISLPQGHRMPIKQRKQIDFFFQS